MINTAFLSCLSLFFFSQIAFAQSLRPGFIKSELLELLKIGARTSADSIFYNKLPAPEHSTLVYQSGLVGFDNLWQLWLRNDNVAIISIRGTTKTTVSFYANLYAAMVSAHGELNLEKDYVFKYNLSSNPKAAVHTGYLVAAAYLLRDILPRIDSCVKNNIREFIITGHSQGGAISYLLTSEFDNLRQQGRFPADIKFKTVAVGAPKPGNLFYAYSFEHLTQNGWFYHLVSALDWVPEVPFSIQTMTDLNDTNPFRNAKQLLGQQKFPINLGATIAYNQLSRPARKAQRKYQKWLGKRFSKYVGKYLTSMETPVFFPSNDYVRTGTTIVLIPDSLYYPAFPQIKDSIWRNHTQKPYLFLAERLPDNDDAQTTSKVYQQLGGAWELDYIANQRQAFNAMYPDKKPRLLLNIEKNSFTGNSGCNELNGKMFLTGNKVTFSQPVAMTKMLCSGEGESVFLQALSEVNNFSLSAQSLTLIIDDMALLHFVRPVEKKTP